MSKLKRKSYKVEWCHIPSEKAEEKIALAFDLLLSPIFDKPDDYINKKSIKIRDPTNEKK